MKKKLMGAVLTVTMLCGLTACGRTGSDKGNGETITDGTPAASAETGMQDQGNIDTGETAAGTDSTENKAAGQTHDTVSVTIFQDSSRWSDADNEMVHDAILEKTGIDLKLNYVSENASQKYALLVAGSTVPDISVISADMYLEYAKQGAYCDLTGLVEQYPDLMEYVPESFWDRVKVDGKIYGIPTKNTEGKYNLYYRGDWLEKLGLSIPENREEFTEILRAFTQDDPDGNGKNDTYGYGNSEFRTFYAMYGIMPGYYHEKDGKVVIDAISDDYKECLRYIHDMYQAGYLDPEIFTDTEDQFKQKVNTGKCGVFTGWWSVMGQFLRDYGFPEAQPGGSLITTEPPVNAAAGQGMPANDSMSNIICFSYKDVDILEKLLNYVNWISTDEGYRICKYGIEGVHWSMEDGEMTYNVIWDAEKKRLDGKPIEGNDMETYCILQRMDIYPEQLDENFAVPFEQAEKNPLYRNLFVGLSSEDYMTYNADITKLCDEMRVKFILGEESFDNWDKYVKEYVATGGLKVAESLLAEYNRVYGKSLILEPVS